MKKLFTLVALLTCFLGAKAADTEEVVDVEYDFATVTADNWQHGWVDADNAAPYLSIEDGCLHFHNDEAKSQRYEIQFQPFPGVSSVDNDFSYTVTLKIKGTPGKIDAYFSGGDLPGTIDVTADWQTLTFDGCMNDPEDQYFKNSGSILIQCGDFVGDWYVSYVKITHKEKKAKPVEWLENITNGDASADWPAWSLEEKEPGINANWRGDRTGEICAWGLTMGRNEDNLDGQDGRSRPVPADIVELDGNRVFMVDATQCAVIDKGESIDENSFKWANQFWIQSPKGWRAGTDIKLHFRYKATVAVTAETQIHKQHPSDYLIWHAIGDVAFTEEWQEYDGTLTFADDMDGGWSVAFNLQGKLAKPEDFVPVKFYFDDISWQSMKLDEGWFAAASNTTTGIEYDYENAIAFEGPDDEGAYHATVGTAGKQDTWVNEVMVSTIRGNDKAFKGATVKPSGTITGTDEDEWLEYTPASQYKIQLPAAGVWKISVAPETTQIRFLELEGDKPATKDPVAIVTNETENVVNATEREDLKDEWDNNNQKLNVREEADNNPADEHGIGGEGHNGQTWDNQFWIAANRNLAKDEVTVLKFKYKASKAAKTSTQAHKVGDDGKPCTYLNWQAIGDVNFTEEWQDFSTEFTVPAGDDGMRSIVFNMAEIKEACDYYIKDVQWYLKDATLEAEGKTYENLINATGAQNFWTKVSAGTPVTGITNVTAKTVKTSAAIYNIAGQRVNKNYKGLVVKDGKKVVLK